MNETSIQQLQISETLKLTLEIQNATIETLKVSLEQKEDVINSLTSDLKDKPMGNTINGLQN